MRFNDLRRETQVAIVIFLVVVAGLLAIALYGWLTGAWEWPVDWRETSELSRKSGVRSALG
jgi:hypothetical protein